MTFIIVEMTMKKSKFQKLLWRKIYKITTCASVNATGGTIKNRTDSASDGIDGGTGCNFIFLIHCFNRK